MLGVWGHSKETQPSLWNTLGGWGACCGLIVKHKPQQSRRVLSLFSLPNSRVKTCKFCMKEADLFSPVGGVRSKFKMIKRA